VGLTHPADLEAWRAWQAGRRPIRRLKQKLRPPAPKHDWLVTGGSRPRILVVLESLSPSNRAAFVAPLAHLDLTDVAVLAPTDVTASLPRHPWTAQESLSGLGSDVAAVLAPGHYTALGDLAWQLALERGTPFLVAQHGLMTPLAPPLPDGAHLLAWSRADADFWWSGRDGDATVVGSQLLTEAGRLRAAPVDGAARPTYLGQLHGAELPRRDLARAADTFCLAHGATYRPHPSEADRLSRLQHRRWERRGITVDRSGASLTDLRTPVVSVFSTGVLEAAARGIPAWVDFPDPPEWLEEFWDRYDMRRYGGEPTAAPVEPATEPAAAIAEILRSHL
jgi:hypothetical protein